MTSRAKTAIGRSLDVYYRDADRTKRMDDFHATLVQPGALVFDIGAHVGDRTGSFERLGARVVALEPQPRVFRALRLMYFRTPRVTLRNEAVGAERGTLTMFLNSSNPTVSTASPDLIAAAASSPDWQGQNWDQEVRVDLTTLDLLIAEFGVPDFVKIDVEGFERAVLDGLSTPLPCLSFEFTTIQRDVAMSCLERLAHLGEHVFNYSLGEDHELVFDNWVSGNAMHARIDELPDEANSGDIFACHIR